MESIINNINQVSSDFRGIKEHIVNNGVEVADGTPTSEYAGKVDEVFEAGKKSQYDEFWDAFQDWDEVQQKATKTDYRYAFSYLGWNDTSFKPKYDIRPTNAQAIFHTSKIVDLVGILKQQNIELDFSQATNLNHLFQMSSVETCGVIDTRSSNSVTSLIGENYKLVTIEKIILKEDGSQDTTSMFWYPAALKNVVIEGIIGKNISCANAKNLTRDSLLGKPATAEQIAEGKNLFTVNGNTYYGGIFGALKVFESGSNTCAITLHATPKGLLSDAEKQVVRDKGWTIA